MSAVSAELREAVCLANQDLAGSGLVEGTFGNVSGVDRANGVFVIKPSGVAYEELTPDVMVPVSLETGRVLDGSFRPSSDTPTHLELYRAFPCGGIAHTHSEMATAFAQARLAIPCLGTTHADHFHGDVPVTRALTETEVATDYERHTGHVIVEAFETLGLSPMEIPGALVASHGPFAWGTDAAEAVVHAQILEQVARMAFVVHVLAPDAERPAAHLIDKHYFRKHGDDAYYGQP
ncbi:MAG TPA: L-ribulose-5-phosphate 4-epimerase AraD [Gemmatimonadales bacterium]|nr:L-ribulose-5-phosphate 4-epimerase AraD [Gemmatimonadales bacterium]